MKKYCFFMIAGLLLIFFGGWLISIGAYWAILGTVLVIVGIIVFCGNRILWLEKKDFRRRMIQLMHKEDL